MRSLPLAVTLSFASIAFGLTPGAIVTDGESIPVIADVNGDGLDDVPAGRRLLVNQGNGVFVKRDLDLGGNFQVIESSDFNGDGRADLLAFEDGSNAPGGGGASKTRYRVYLTGADLSFAAGADLDLRTGFVPHAAADMNGDGRDDLVFAHALHEGVRNAGMELKVALSNGDGTFAFREIFKIAGHPQGNRAHRLLAGDIDRDGHVDLLMRTIDELIVVRGLGNGNMAAPDARFLPMQPFGWWASELADVDGDGNLDVLLANFRVVRVFFGDGKGKFPRVAMAQVRKLHEAVVPPNLQHLPLDQTNQPRNFALGQFVRSGRNEIAVGTGEGDAVVFAWENGALREVDRGATELLALEVFSGRFYERGRTDLMATGNLSYGSGMPRPRLLVANPLDAEPDKQKSAGRSRAVRGLANQPLALEVRVTGSDCEIDVAEVWNLHRDGIFGFERTADRTVETVLENGLLSFRITAPWTRAPVTGALTANGNRYSGLVEMDTACGWKRVQFTAIIR